MEGAGGSVPPALSAARAERERVAEELAARGGELAAAKEETAKVEAEMRLVLKAMDAQKAAATRNMATLSKMYDDFSAASM